MKRFLCGFVVLSVVGVVCWAAPEPAIVPGPSDWTVDVRFSHLQQIELRLAGDTKPRRFWYVILTLTNNTGRDVSFYPKCDLMTDTFEIIPAGKGVPEAVFERIKKRHEDRYPFLESLEGTSARILQGADNAKDVAVIWPDFDLAAKAVHLFITGLSNETAAIEHPVAKDKQGRAVKVFLRKTLELDYGIGGDPAFRSEAKVLYKGKSWVMR